MDAKGKPYAVDLNEMLEDKFADSSYAIEYLKEALEDEDLELFFAALGDMAKVNGMKNLSESTGLNRESLYRMLSVKGNPTFKNVFDILSELGLKLSVSYKTVQAATVFNFERPAMDSSTEPLKVEMSDLALA